MAAVDEDSGVAGAAKQAIPEIFLSHVQQVR
jgi:hypothetical protein